MHGGPLPLHGPADLAQWGGTRNRRRRRGVIAAFASRQDLNEEPRPLVQCPMQLRAAGVGWLEES